MDDKNGSFKFSYSAKEQSEVESIRKKYLPQEENKIDQLRRLDRSANQKAQAWSIGLGVIGALLLGTGMSLFMSELGGILGLVGILPSIIGISVGLVGMVLVALAYPVYNRVLQKERRRIAPEILRLTDELLK